MVRRFVPRDSYARKALEQGYLARSAFKLERINEKFHILRPAFHVLDLGAAPGSWLQVASREAGPRGLVVGVDLTPVSFSAPNVVALTADILSPDFPDRVLPFAPFDTVLSDAAPRTTGIRDRDQAGSLALVEAAVETARSFMKRGGALVAKAFESEDIHRLVRVLANEYESVRTFKPPASRDRSYETYLIARGKKEQAALVNRG
ncbi:MAG: Ribosomal RNA large subunit methyltransferase E [Candidatus Latescibacteria bacterium ADurb.Bin168]|nr:MAG: Ribosomal RNA large subunit methyltransferase E [Candidatus Latescibacteria bacterium ADurb.Bin168]